MIQKKKSTYMVCNEASIIVEMTYCTHATVVVIGVYKTYTLYAIIKRTHVHNKSTYGEEMVSRLWLHFSTLHGVCAIQNHDIVNLAMRL